MTFWPAIDLMDGRCVRLHRGEKTRRTDYAGDPAAVAAGFEFSGADGVHLVDLDGAFEGQRKNLPAIRAVAAAVKIPVEVGGGIRTADDIRELLDAGVSRVILGTAAVRNPELVSSAIKAFGAERIVVGIDARDGKVAVKGWTETTAVLASELGLQMKALGVQTLIYTDIQRDGALEGPNLPETKAMAVATGLDVIASGGVSSLQDIRNLLLLENDGVCGIIAGKAVYEGVFTVDEVCRLIQRHAIGALE